MKVLYIPSLNLPIIFWRIESYAEQLLTNKENVTHVEYMIDPRDPRDWSLMAFNYGEVSKKIQETLYSAFKYFDYIIFQRIQNKEGVALISKFKKDFPKVKVFVDIDDSVGEVSIDSNLPWKNHHRWSMEQIAQSDGLICSTQYLADSVRELLPDIKIHVAPNCINTDLWKPELKIKQNKVKKIGYVGGGGHDSDLLIAYTGLKPLLDTENIKLVIRSGGYRPEWLTNHDKIDFKRVNWHISEYPQKLADLNLDIGIAPLRDSEFNRCKSNIKYLEMASVGVPLVASDVEPYRNEPLITLSENDPHVFAQTVMKRLNEFRNKDVLISDHKIKYNMLEQSNNLLQFLKYEISG